MFKHLKEERGEKERQLTVLTQKDDISLECREVRLSRWQKPTIRWKHSGLCNPDWISPRCEPDVGDNWTIVLRGLATETLCAGMVGT